MQRDPHGMPAAVRDRAIRQAIAVDQRLSGPTTGSLAQAAAALAKAGQPDAAQILSGQVSPGPPGGIDGLAGVRYEVAGETALTGDAIGSVFADLGRTIGG